MYNILCCDDSELSLIFIKKYLLDTFGDLVKVDCFINGESARTAVINKLKTNDRYNLAILDWLMPDITGEILSMLLKKEDPTLITVLYTESTELFFGPLMNNFQLDAALSKKYSRQSLNEIGNIVRGHHNLPLEETHEHRPIEAVYKETVA